VDSDAIFGFLVALGSADNVGSFDDARFLKGAGSEGGAVSRVGVDSRGAGSDLDLGFFDGVFFAGDVSPRGIAVSLNFNCSIKGVFRKGMTSRGGVTSHAGVLSATGVVLSLNREGVLGACAPIAPARTDTYSVCKFSTLSTACFISPS
jgi:hypothetical protein